MDTAPTAVEISPAAVAPTPNAEDAKPSAFAVAPTAVPPTPALVADTSIGLPLPSTISGSPFSSTAVPPTATLVSLAKGVETGTLMRMSQVIAEVTGAEADRIAVLSGPNLAREIAAEQPTATVIACPDSVRAVAVQRACATGYFRPYTNTDVIGCEVGGACKNVIALCSGMAAGGEERGEVAVDQDGARARGRPT